MTKFVHDSKMKIIETYILSWDTAIATALTLACLYFLPDLVEFSLALSLLEVGISVLSIVFSIFFAALAFIMSAGDDEFVAFLEEDNLFTYLIQTFKWTVGSLFIALLYSIIAFIIASFCQSSKNYAYFYEEVLVIFCFLFFYSLIATALTTNDAIKYSQGRIKFMEAKKSKDKKN